MCQTPLKGIFQFYRFIMLRSLCRQCRSYSTRAPTWALEAARARLDSLPEVRECCVELNRRIPASTWRDKKKSSSRCVAP